MFLVLHDIIERSESCHTVNNFDLEENNARCIELNYRIIKYNVLSKFNCALTVLVKKKQTFFRNLYKRKLNQILLDFFFYLRSTHIIIDIGICH